MSSLDPQLFIETTFGSLSGTSATDVYTVTDEEKVHILSIRVTDSTGSVATACKVDLRRSSTNYTLAGTGLALPSATEDLEVLGWPGIVLKRGDIIRLTGASGHHWFITYSPVRSTGLSAQR